MIDMHAHLACFTEGYEEIRGETELDFRLKNGITTCFSAGTPSEWQVMEGFRSRREIIVSFGIHPWHSGRYQVEECREYLELCGFVGEIGMDSVWCEVPLKLQQRRLEEQLQIAADLGKPVLLHTKGQEEKIADIIKGFPGSVCVHWYSGSKSGFEKFLEQDCYFTLGPDTAMVWGENRSLIGTMVREIPADRLFLETDGLPAIAWAKGVEHIKMEEIPAVLKHSLEYTAVAKGWKQKALACQIRENLERWLAMGRAAV